MAVTKTYDIGDLVRCSGAFTNTLNVPIDPTVVICKIKPPSGVVVIYTYGIDAALVKDSVGNYHLDVNANAPGVWRYRFYSTGIGQAAQEESFEVRPSYF